jgi:hypothetical protein
MNPAQLARWKEREDTRAKQIVDSIGDLSPSSIRNIYPEWSLEGAYTTSVEPHVPIWAMIPFFSKIIVGIIPYFRDESAFQQWYGLSVRQLLRLHEGGYLLIRVLYPRAGTSVPKFLNPFFAEEFPSTARDIAFDNRRLGDAVHDLRARFARLVSGYDTTTSIDGFHGHKRRAIKTAEMAFLQLHALGYVEQATQFELMFRSSPQQAMNWLELCRIFLVSPYHYSLLGIHSVAGDATPLAPAPRGTVRFPSELGRILIKTFELIRIEDAPDKITLEETVAVHPDFDLARNTLLALDAALKSGREEDVVETADDLRGIVERAKRKQRLYLRSMRFVIASGIAGAALSLNPLLGLLVTLGVHTVGEFAAETIDRAGEPLTRHWLERKAPHLGLIMKLDQSVRRSFCP